MSDAVEQSNKIGEITGTVLATRTRLPGILAQSRKLSRDFFDFF
jgi:hypothetical protein